MVLIPLLLGLPLACSTGTPEALPSASPERRARVAMVGIDGGDWDILLPLIDQGLMPALATMRAQGVTARLDIDSAQSPNSWTSIATGVHPEVHGIQQEQSGRGGVYRATPHMLHRHRIWDMATRRDRSSFVSHYWVTGPAYPIKGVMLPREGNDAFPADAFELRGANMAPSRHASEIGRLGLGLLRPRVVSAWLEREDFDLTVLPYYGHDQALHMLYAEAMAAGDADVLAQLNPAQQERVELAAGIVRETARLADRLVQQAIDEVGPDGYVMVFSDHGHTATRDPERRIALSRSVLDGQRGTVEQGELQLDGHTLQLKLQVDRPELPEALAYALRMPKIFLPDDDGSTRAQLLALRTSTGDPLLEPLGTALVPSEPVRRACRQATARLERPTFSCFVNSGSHGLEDQGIFALIGPGVKPGPLDGPVATVDLTPTALWLMGLPTADDLAGRPLTQALIEPHPVEQIATWENGHQPWKAVGPSTQDPVEVEEWLKAMGYIDG